MVYDLVTPVPEGHGAQGPSQRRAPHQPQDFREGVSNAYDVVASVSSLTLSPTLCIILTMTAKEETSQVGGFKELLHGCACM